MRKKRMLTLVAVLCTAILMSCSNNDDDLNQTAERQFGIFRVLSDDVTLEMNGTINSASLTNFNRLAAAFPSVNKINIKNCDGSSDDDVNLQLSAKVHQKGMNIHLMDNGEIASGGVDFFIAGRQRTKGSNTRIGVHSWSGDGSVATDFPVGHANHLPYINYYVSVGFTQQQAESFYYFTINAAPAATVHWMTDAEIAQYHLITQ